MMLSKFALAGCASLMAVAASYPAIGQTAGNSGTPAAAGTVRAQPAPNADAGGEIVVTAQKRSERLQDVPMSLNAASGDQLKTLGITSTDQLEKIVPGFTAEKTVYGLPVYFIRGIGFNDTTLGVSPAVTVYTDQLPLPFSPMSRGATLDVERVEILKGPQGTLFGENSTGGAINYIAAKPTTSVHSGFDLTYGRFNQVDTEAFISGPVTSTLSARVAIRNEYQGDWQQGYTTNETIGQKHFQNGRFLLDWKPTSKLKAEFMATSWRDRSDTQQPQFVEYAPTAPIQLGRPVPTYPIATFPTAPSRPRAAAWDPGHDFRRNDYFYQFSGRIDYALTDQVAVTSLTSYERYKSSVPIDLDGTTLPLDITTDHGRIQSFSQELRASGTFDRVKWLVGGNYEHDRVDEVLQFNPTLEGGDHIGPFYWTQFLIDNSQKITTKSGFGSLDYRISDTLTAQGSARYTAQNRSFAGCARDPGDGNIARAFGALGSALSGSPQVITPGACVTLSNVGTPLPIVNAKLDQSNVSWRASLNWKPVRSALLYANVTKGYKAGSFPTLPAATASQYVPVRQESVLAYETGFKVDLLSRKLQVDGAAFYYDYKDKQLVGYLVVLPFGPLPGLVTIPKARVWGGELSVTLRPVTGLTVTANGTYVNTRVQSNPINPTGPFGNPASFTGQPFPYTPKWQGVVDAQYRFPVTSSLFAYAGTTITSRTGTDGALLSGAPTLASQEALLRIHGYTLIDLRAGIEPGDGRWRLEIWGRNIADRFYAVGATRNADYVSRFTGMPATYGVSVRYRY